MATADLSPILQQQNSIYNQFAQQSAANTFARNRASQKGQQGLADFRQGFQRQLPKFTAGFGRRGLAGGGIQSGVFQGAMQNYVGDYTKNLGRMEQDVWDTDQQYNFDQQRFAADRDQALASLQAQKALLIAQTAQHINGLRPYLGGA